MKYKSKPSMVSDLGTLSLSKKMTSRIGTRLRKGSLPDSKFFQQTNKQISSELSITSETQSGLFSCQLEGKLMKLSRDKMLKETIDLSSTTKLLWENVGDLSFIIHTATQAIKCKADTSYDYQLWVSGISKVTGISPTLEKRRRKSSALCKKVYRKSDSKGSKYGSWSCPSALMTTGVSTRSPVESWFSLQQEIELKGDIYLAAGSVEDIIKWCILISDEPEKQKDSAALFAGYSMLQSNLTLGEAIKNTWRGWNDKPDLFPKVNTRFVNFAFQYMESPLTMDFNEEITSREVVRSLAIFSCPKYENYLMGAKRPYKCFLQETKIRYDILTEDVFRFPVNDIALQITIYENELFQWITTQDMLSTDGIGRTPVFESLLHFHDKLSRWITATVLQAYSVKEKSCLYQKCEELAKELLELQNYNSCAAVVSGLFSPFLLRLTELQKEIPDRSHSHMAKLQNYFSSKGNYHQYRQLPTEPASIPFLEILLKDIAAARKRDPVESADGAVISLKNMRAIYGLMLPVTFMNIDFFFSLETNGLLKRHIMSINPPSHQELEDYSLFLQREEGNNPRFELQCEQKKLKEELIMLKDREAKQIIAKQQLLLKLLLEGHENMLESLEETLNENPSDVVDLLCTSLDLIGQQQLGAVN